MNFQQLKYVRAAVQNDLNLTRVANELFTSQSGVSKQIKELETELRLEIFVRRGKRLIGTTPAGDNAIQVIERLLQEADNLKRLSDQFVGSDKGHLVIATTHNQANYVLPRILVQFRSEYPEVEVELRQSSPEDIVRSLVRGEADLGIATEAVDGHPELDTLPCFTWTHVAIVPPGHPLAAQTVVTLADIAAHPLVTYNNHITGRSHIDAAFASAGLSPDVRLTAMDADVIKTYVRLGMGVGIVAQMAVANAAPDAQSDRLLVLPGSETLFAPCATKVAIHHGTLLRNYASRLVELLAPHADTRKIRKTGLLAGDADISSFAERADLLLDQTARTNG